MPISITKENYDAIIIKSSKPAIIDVFAPWCGPCQQMVPIFEELEKEYGDTYTFAKLNVDESRELALQFGVTSIPTFIFLKNGKIQGKEVGYIAKDDLIATIKELLR